MVGSVAYAGARMASLRIAIASEGRLEPGTWSGTVSGLAGGLRAHGATVVHVSASGPRRVERALERLPSWRARNRWRDAVLAANLRRAGALDALVVIGSTAAVRAAAPIFTYDDMTLPQAIAVGETWVTDRSPDELAAWRARQRDLYARAHGACAMSRWAADSIVGDYGVPSDRVHVIGAGINHAVEAGARDWSAPRFLLIGREFERKNGPAVLRAFAALHAERPDARLDVVGGHPRIDAPGVVGHGPLSLADRDERERIEELLAAATCFVMPSRHEPFGIAYCEAGRAGVPSIATTVGGAFVDDTCGRLVDPSDEAALLKAMRELCDGEVARELGVRAREKASAFTWPLVGGRLIRCVAGALGQPVEGLPELL